MNIRIAGSALFVLLILSSDIFAQAVRRRALANNSDDYKSLLAFGINANTNSGILGGANVRHTSLLPGKFMGKTQYQYLALEIVNVKSPKIGRASCRERV